MSDTISYTQGTRIERDSILEVPSGGLGTHCFFRIWFPTAAAERGPQILNSNSDSDFGLAKLTLRDRHPLLRNRFKGRLATTKLRTPHPLQGDRFQGGLYRPRSLLPCDRFKRGLAPRALGEAPRRALHYSKPFAWLFGAGRFTIRSRPLHFWKPSASNLKAERFMFLKPAASLFEAARFTF